MFQLSKVSTRLYTDPENLNYNQYKPVQYTVPVLYSQHKFLLNYIKPSILDFTLTFQKVCLKCINVAMLFYSFVKWSWYFSLLMDTHAFVKNACTVLITLNEAFYFTKHVPAILNLHFTLPKSLTYRNLAIELWFTGCLETDFHIY